MSSERIVTWEELASHVALQDGWVLIDGMVYDVSKFIQEHPGGQPPLLKNIGLDATQNFKNMGHSLYAIDLRNNLAIGKITSDPCPQNYRQKVQQNKQQQQKQSTIKANNIKNIHPDADADFISRQLIKRHNTEKDCWVLVDGKVCDVTGFLQDHPGGADALLTHAGKDITKIYNQVHKKDGKMPQQVHNKRDSLKIGVVRKNANMPLVIIVGTALLIIATIASNINFQN